MANTSILAAFERFWLHVVALVGNKANIDHTHATADGGFAGGTNASATAGAALGNGATTTVGGSVGYGATSGFGGAVGRDASATYGFSGGDGAKSTADAIQLGRGTNTESYSVQAYDKKLMNGDGYIPFARYAKFVQGTTAQSLSAGTTSNSHKVYTETNTSSTNPGSVIIIPVIRGSFNLVASLRYASGETYIVVSRPEGGTSNSYTNYYVDYWILSEKPV